ncbi:MAG: DUF4345 domain-containing protein [Granulosicoccus sp.]
MKISFEKIQAVVLFVSGTLLALVGAAIITSPAAFFGSNSIELGQNISLLNELKAPAGLLLAAGIIMIIAVFREKHYNFALGLSALIYLSYAAGRTMSMVVDGAPASGLVLAAVLEAAIGLACLLVIQSRRAPATKLA